MEQDTLIKDATGMFCTVHAAHRQLGRTPAYPTLLKMAKDGRIPGVWQIGKLLLIPQAWVDEKLKQAELPDFLS